MKWSITWTYKPEGDGWQGAEVSGTTHEADSEYMAREWAEYNAPAPIIYKDCPLTITVEPYKSWADDLLELIERAKARKQ